MASIFCNIPISVSTIPTFPVFNVQRVCCRWWILLGAHSPGKPVKDCLTALSGHAYLAESAVFSPDLASSANIIHLAWCRGGELVFTLDQAGYSCCSQLQKDGQGSSPTPGCSLLLQIATRLQDSVLSQHGTIV